MKAEIINQNWSHPFSIHAKFFEKLTFLAHWYVHVREEMLGFFWKFLRTDELNG